MALLGRARRLGAIDSYGLQAAISAEHARATSYAATDWRGITTLYAELHDLQPSPVIRLNEPFVIPSKP